MSQENVESRRWVPREGIPRSPRQIPDISSYAGVIDPPFWVNRGRRLLTRPPKGGSFAGARADKDVQPEAKWEGPQRGEHAQTQAPRRRLGNRCASHPRGASSRGSGFRTRQQPEGTE